MDINQLMMVDLPVPHDDGSFINERISRVTEIIRERYPMLDVRWIPPNRRADGDSAFAIVECLPDGREVVAFYVQNEAEFDERVLEKIYLADNTKHDINARIEAKNQAHRDLQQKKFQEQMQEAHEISAAILRSPKSTYKYNGYKYQ